MYVSNGISLPHALYRYYSRIDSARLKREGDVTYSWQ
jgi:hypothetical protein